MNHAFSVFLFAAFLTSCSSDEVIDSPSLEKEIESEAVVDPKAVSEDKTYHFKSDGEGVVEYMRCTIMPDGTHRWVYYTSKNDKHIELGAREQAGFEVVYFKGKPKELYWIYGSECGFTLSDDTRKASQWYGQVTPRCADDMFEN